MGGADEETEALTVTDPDTFALAAGAMIETVGAGGPALDVVMVTPAEVPCWPLESVATAVSV